MISTKQQIDRLTKEWLQHGKIIIAVDFDDTISPWKLAEKGDCDEVIAAIKEAKYTGAYIVIFTACNKDRYKEVEEYCKSKGLLIDSINANPIELPYGNQSKVYANIFIDDRGGLNEALFILERALYTVRGSLQHLKPLDDIA